MGFRFQPQSITEIVLVRADCYQDARGFFVECYRRSIFEQNGIREVFLQDNLSHSAQNVLRGLHFQNPPKAQAKLVIPLFGEIYDVVVDLRCGSPTYGKWVACVLSAARHEALYVPGGFAHGFCVMSESATVLYKASCEYAPECEGGVRWNDPDLQIPWPCENPVVSARDAALPLLREVNSCFYLEPRCAASSA
ncbi:MAG: dTDP-4-dehydrorhamnose 3,5-epimerase [Verrucomicrobiae bacterium]|nr:dTDP-4-dehydrorhamnose 3,5-epimerase [Verrucomicrobiae bacterium]